VNATVFSRVKQVVLDRIADRGRLRSSEKNKIFFLITVGILVSGSAILGIGLIPQETPNYVLVARGYVPNADANGTYITDPAQYYATHINIGLFDVSNCPPQGNGYLCSFSNIQGYRLTTDVAAQEYGAGIIAVGVIALTILFRPLPTVEAEPGYNSKKIRIIIDEGICVANSVCVGIAPKVFQLEPEKKGALAPKAKVIDLYGADNDTIIEAAKMCPTYAIIIEDAETGERIFPVPK
jgi:ferredoxin